MLSCHAARLTRFNILSLSCQLAVAAERATRVGSCARPITPSPYRGGSNPLHVALPVRDTRHGKARNSGFRDCTRAYVQRNTASFGNDIRMTDNVSLVASEADETRGSLLPWLQGASR